MKLGLGIFVACWLAAAVSASSPGEPAVPGFRGVPVERSDVVVTDPPVGVTTTRRVGDTLIRVTAAVESIYELPAGTVVLLDTASSTWGFMEGRRRVVALAGTTGPQKAWGENWPTLCINSQMLPPTRLDDTVGCFVDTDGDGKFDVSVYPTYKKQHAMDAPARYQVMAESMRVQRQLAKQPTFATEMVYQGVSKGEAKIAYREFTNDMARPAFNQDLTYELDADGSAVMVFRDIRLRVIKATREEVTYVVDAPSSRVR